MGDGLQGNSLRRCRPLVDETNLNLTYLGSILHWCGSFYFLMESHDICSEFASSNWTMNYALNIFLEIVSWQQLGLCNDIIEERKFYRHINLYLVCKIPSYIKRFCLTSALIDVQRSTFSFDWSPLLIITDYLLWWLTYLFMFIIDFEKHVWQLSI
jgi:hypothetical protein